GVEALAGDRDGVAVLVHPQVGLDGRVGEGGDLAGDEHDHDERGQGGRRLQETVAPADALATRREVKHESSPLSPVGKRTPTPRWGVISGTDKAPGILKIGTCVDKSPTFVGMSKQGGR